MLLAIIDTETTGLSPQDSALVEIACVLYRVGYGVIKSASTLLPVAGNPSKHINGISPEMTKAVLPGSTLALISMYLEEADFIVAHNAAFDKSFLLAHDAFRHIKQPWLCTYEDFQWEGCKGRSLSEIALRYGLAVDGSQAHRAMYDCQLIARIFDAVGDRLPRMIEVAAQPRFLYKALVDYGDREKAKEAGFFWDVQKKAWVKKMTEEKASLFEFDTVLVN